MHVNSIAECSKGSILQYFRPSLSYHLSLRSFFLSIFEQLFYTGFTVFLILSFILDHTTDHVQSAGKDHTVTDNTNQVLLYS